MTISGTSSEVDFLDRARLGVAADGEVSFLQGDL
jgi:hypothetical protein